MSLQDYDTMGPEIEGWIRSLVTSKARFHDTRMHELAATGRLSEIYIHAHRMLNLAVAQDAETTNQNEPAVQANDWDNTMAALVIGAMKRQREILDDVQVQLSHARLEDMLNRTSYLHRDTFDS